MCAYEHEIVGHVCVVCVHCLQLGTYARMHAKVSDFVSLWKPFFGVMPYKYQPLPWDTRLAALDRLITCLHALSCALHEAGGR